MNEIWNNLDFILNSREFFLFLLVMLFDIITGFGKAVINKNVNSTISRESLIRKATVLLLVSALGAILGQGQEIIFTSILVAFSTGEVASVLENLHLMGIKIPPILLKYLSSVKVIDDEVIEHVSDQSQSDSQ
jgi:toxin secretion/phage lysis holin